MKFLLVAVNAKYIHSNPGIYSLYAYAKSRESIYEEQIEIAEFTINHKIEDIVSGIYEKKPDMIGFSCYIWNIRQIMEIANEIAKLLPEIPIWFGGPEVSFDTEKLIRKHDFMSGIIIGEGEETFFELMEFYRGKGSSLKEIPGLLLESGYTKPREILSLDQVPFLYADNNDFTNRIIYYESSRGCPFQCSYCLSSIDKKLRFRDIQLVQEELQYFLDCEVRQVKFVDRTFNCNHKHAMAIWNYLLENDNGITNFHFEVAADLLTEEELSLLAKFRPGAVQLEIGVQTTNEKTLQEIRRTMDIERLKHTVYRIHRGENIHQHLDLIAGLPHEDYGSFQNSFNQVYAMQPQQLQLGFLKVLKGSHMYEKAEEYGINYMSQPPYEVLYSNWITYEEMRQLKMVEEMVELYYNSNQFRTTLPALLTFFNSPFAFYYELAEYYKKKDYFLNSPSRIYRYDILVDFAKEQESITKEQIDWLSELLTKDTYLRENIKKRPNFAKDFLEADMLAYKKEIREFYKQEEKEPAYLKDYQEYDAKQMARLTHIEVFLYDTETGSKLADPNYVLFDYKNRNPLTNDAKIYYISGEEHDKKNKGNY